MNVKHFRWLFLPLLVALLVTMFSVDTPFTIGLSGEFSIIGLSGGCSQDKYRIAGGTAPWALAFSVIVIGLYFLLMCAPPAEHGQKFSSWWRRLAAFWLDFFLAVAAVAPILGLIPTFTEWRRTGVFVWNFERATFAPGDGLLFAVLFALAIPAFAFYFSWPLLRRRPSPGTCIMGYQIVADEGAALTLGAALKRTLLGVTFLGDRYRTKFRVDAWFGTHAVKLK